HCGNGWISGACSNKNCRGHEFLSSDDFMNLKKNVTFSKNINGESKVILAEVYGNRVCPVCGIGINWREGCKHMCCPSCLTEFCFVCLQQKLNGVWPCGSFNQECK